MAADGSECTCTLYIKGRSHPVRVTEYKDECFRATEPWKTMPKRMLRHKALIQSARVAFGFSGIYDEDEAERIRDRMAVIKNDIAALDRVLSTLGYTGDLNKEMPRQKHERIFGQGELTRAILDVLRDATEPMATRDIARQILAVNEQDARDRRLLTEVTRRVSKALRIQAGRQLVEAKCDPGSFHKVWLVKPNV
jgi:hypothetical protein